MTFPVSSELSLNPLWVQPKQYFGIFFLRCHRTQKSVLHWTRMLLWKDLHLYPLLRPLRLKNLNNDGITIFRNFYIEFKGGGGYKWNSYPYYTVKEDNYLHGLRGWEVFKSQFYVCIPCAPILTLILTPLYIIQQNVDNSEVFFLKYMYNLKAFVRKKNKMQPLNWGLN